jgi:hypothetical protein
LAHGHNPRSYEGKDLERGVSTYYSNSSKRPRKSPWVWLNLHFEGRGTCVNRFGVSQRLEELIRLSFLNDPRLRGQSAPGRERGCASSGIRAEILFVDHGKKGEGEKR